jgi:hypothetical protein
VSRQVGRIVPKNHPIISSNLNGIAADAGCWPLDAGRSVLASDIQDLASSIQHQPPIYHWLNFRHLNIRKDWIWEKQFVFF